MNAQAGATPAAIRRRPGAVGTIVWIGLVAGTLDISENLIFNWFRGITPKMVFQFIASGLIGERAFRAGAASVALGVLLHFTIALTWTAVFYTASRRWAILGRRAVVCGLVYGAAVYGFMNAIVLPLSKVPRSRAPMTAASRISGILALLFCIGLTISLLVRWSDRRASGPVAD